MQRPETIYVYRDTVAVNVIKPPPSTIADRLEPYSWVVGLIALLVSFRALRWQVLVPRQERRLANYRALVLDRALDSLDEFEESSLKLLELATADLSGFRADHNEVEGLKTAKRFASAYRDCLNPMSFRILASLKAWAPQHRLWGRLFQRHMPPAITVHNALSELDGLIEKVYTLRLRHLPHSETTEWLHEHCSLLRAALVQLPERTN